MNDSSDTLYPEWIIKNHSAYEVSTFINHSKSKNFQLVEALEHFCELIHQKIENDLSSFEINQLRLIEEKTQELADKNRISEINKIADLLDDLRYKIESAIGDLDTAIGTLDEIDTK